MDFGAFILTAACAYFLGAIPTGFLVGKARGVDIRTMGSGNIGATNAFRLLGKTAGILVLVVDGLKGVLACLLLRFGPPDQAEINSMVAGVFAILGHNFTFWLKFKGGKGIATSAGVLIALVPKALLVVLAAWILTALVTRYISVASIVAAICLPFAVAWTGYSGLLVGVAVLLSMLAIFKHRANIQRLRAGTEHKIRLNRTRTRSSSS